MADLKIISEKQVIRIMEDNWIEGIEVIKESFIKRGENRVILPEKNSQIFDQKTQNRINCMPSTIIDEQVCGVKWVSVFPTNFKRNIKNVNGLTIISETVTGQPYAIVASSWLTKFRTAGVAGLASKYLAKEENEIISFIGAGEEAKMHFEIFKLLYPGLKECRISSRTHESCSRFANEFSDKYKDVKFVVCDNNFEKAVKGSDIVVTAISSQEAVLKAEWLYKANFYVHVGGFEDEYDVALKADKIVCDEWDAVKHRGSQTISKMYQDGILKDEDIYAELSEIILEEKDGRDEKDKLIYFNSVGMAYEDVLLAKFVYDKSGQYGEILEI